MIKIIFEDNISEILRGVNKVFSNYKVFVSEANVVFTNKFPIGIKLYNVKEHGTGESVINGIIRLKEEYEINVIYLELVNRELRKIDYLHKSHKLSDEYFSNITVDFRYILKEMKVSTGDKIIEILSNINIINAMKVIQYAIYTNYIDPALISYILNGCLSLLNKHTNFSEMNNLFYLRYLCVNAYDLDNFKISAFKIHK
ncbi:TPA: hypothetical protein JLJ30_003981 [Escherichia coli]|nr:hypothetical protein [Escherichia coli]